ncbi:MAG: excinuclease ABC subunit UvrB [Bacteroidia bacterium]|nr:excinuclease ABC subunit UvrB [Bacteroidia bacterium]
MEAAQHPFVLTTPYQPSGDQPEAIRQLVEGLESGEHAQVLLGVTGSGKTFTIANVIQQTQRPTLILSHNKTLAAQLYAEFKSFFPKNLVEFFISYYDYYQPEAYIASSDVYIEKDLSINQEIEKLRLRATSALLSGRQDVIIVSSVSCIYGMGKPEDFKAMMFPIHQGQAYGRSNFLFTLVQMLYARSELEFRQGNFRVRGDNVEVFPAYDDYGVRFQFFGDELEAIARFDPVTGKTLEKLGFFLLAPANLFVTSREVMNRAIVHIQHEMVQQSEYFAKASLPVEAKRIVERTEFDLEMMRELGFCKGIENYSRHLTGRSAGARPYCLLDYFPEGYLTVVDESHASMPQIRAMYGGDRSRKLTLVEHGFRLPSALDNRPLKFEEFENLVGQVIYVSATPGDYELDQTGGVVVEQIVRPTGLLDPPVEIRPLYNQVDDLLEEVAREVGLGRRVLITTLTKRLSEELARYLGDLGVKARYIHSDIDALERVEILRDLRLGKFDVLVGINLLREGLDLPEVSLVAILDADKEGFLRSERSFIQIAGRAARNSEGRVILYADKVTDSMQKLIDETERRRAKQIAHNTAHGITPTTVHKEISHALQKNEAASQRIHEELERETTGLAADPILAYMTDEQLRKTIGETKKNMERAAKELDFLLAAKFRDEMFALEGLLERRRKSA